MNAHKRFISKSAVRRAICALFATSGLTLAVAARAGDGATAYLSGLPQRCGCALIIAGKSSAALDINVAKMSVSVIDERRHTVAGSNHFRFERPMNEARGRTTIAFSGEFNPATPGMYSLTATFDAGAVSVNGVALDVETYPLHFYEAPVPPHSPELRAGQRFLDAAADRVNGVEGPPIVDPALVDASDTPIGRARIALHPATLTNVDTSVSPHVLTFDAPNVGTLRLHSDADAGHLPGLVPLVNDAEAARLELAYASRLVWTVGRSNLGCVSAGATVASGSVESDSAFAVDHVFRAAGLPTHFNGIGGFGGSDRSSAFITDDPIIVVLHPVGPTKFGGASYSNVGGAQPNLFDLRRDCVAFSARFADGWDFERSFRRASLENEHPDWDAATLAHIRTNEVRVGMTHEMIAWMLGYPPVFGTSTAVDRLEKWDYDNPAPFASTVYFRGDRVAAYDPPGFLP